MQEYFNQSLPLQHGNTTFQCYTQDLPTTSTAPTTLILLVHGAGCTSSSWCLLAQEMRNIHSSYTTTTAQPHVTIAAYDQRGHGATCSDDESNLSLNRLVQDTLVVLQELTSIMDVSQILLVGHSLGGAIVVRAAAIAAASLSLPILGVVVVDIVEGSALASLPHLPALLNTRPDTFPSVEEAIKWSLDARMVNNPSSAIISIPPMLVPMQMQTKEGTADTHKEPPSSEAAKGVASTCNAGAMAAASTAATTATSTAATTAASTATTTPRQFTWRTNLHRTSEYWDEWYRGLSKDFLSVQANKLLILASTDRLDRTLMIGQMQGKFQFEIVQSAGHSVHEDQPKRVALLLWTFLLRISGGCNSAIQVQPLKEQFDKNSMFAKRN
jgi:protein phosphatase methylesterase 1